MVRAAPVKLKPICISWCFGFVPICYGIFWLGMFQRCVLRIVPKYMLIAHSDSNAQQLVYLCCGMYLVKTVASIYSYSREHVQRNGIIMLM